MRRTILNIIGAGMALSLAATAGAQTFTHSETTTLPGSAVPSISGLSSVEFRLGADTGVFCGNGGSDVVLANLDVYSQSPESDAFEAVWDITMRLVDDASGDSADLLFTGLLLGSVRGGAQPASNLNVIFDDPMSRTLILGNALYHVTIGPFTPPGPVGSGRSGAIGAHVECTPAIPEPASLALLGTGVLPVLGLARRRR